MRVRRMSGFIVHLLVPGGQSATFEQPLGYHAVQFEAYSPTFGAAPLWMKPGTVLDEPTLESDTTGEAPALLSYYQEELFAVPPNGKVTFRTVDESAVLVIAECFNIDADGEIVGES
jgi:hypothetical protein